ncbi:hypothetical protein I5J50_gp35 [Mycobacterium phage Purky]|uniref:Uncharacterized protein n=1 Tax=Mycobacterium phage Purky TaxID=2593351 RepID=A0A514TWR5_9CAUD|nr:hypothetical protein I5J50_gp35 [Mycobacterium phage Purky]QDK01140.1 hypothetical protein SEA_PURKY_35 [Mycobacterium phage Purky]
MSIAMPTRRSPWMNDRAGLLVRLLQERHGLQLTESAARDTISDHVDRVAEVMRIGRQSAKPYVTDSVIGEMADRIAAAVQAHRDRGGRPHLRVVE